ncbi:MAG: hypothetical protein RLZZ553_835 [Verrucomicrobiota bacterium]|jgi:hypothetical protein
MRLIPFLPIILVGALAAQEGSSPRATLLAPIILEPIVQPEPQPVLRLDIGPESILETKEIIADGQKITLQEIAPITLPPLPPTPEPQPLTAEQIADRQAALARAPKHRSLMLSCTVFDDKHTRIQGTTRTKHTTERWEAWSNINFHHLSHLPRFQKNDTTYSLFFGISDENTTRAIARHARLGKTYTPPTIPELPADPTTQPRFIVTNGNPTAEDLAPIIGLHELYQDHHKDLISEYIRIKAQQEREAAERLAYPPDPKPDIVIQHWTVTPDAPPASTKLEIIPTKSEEGENK